MNALSKLRASEVEEHDLPATISRHRNLPKPLVALRRWVEERDYCGHDPYNLLNSPFLRGLRARPLCWAVIQAGKLLPGASLRQLLRVPATKNSKALGLFLAGYCDLMRAGHNCASAVSYLKAELQRLRSPGEAELCWGYDFKYVSLRGSSMETLAPNAIATVFCGEALLDLSEISGDSEALHMARSAGRFLATRLNRPIDERERLCFSYTPQNYTLIYNSSALTAAFLARLGARTGNDEYMRLARRAMAYLVSVQQSNGSWYYGAGSKQKWIDSFHTGYNLLALREYQEQSGDLSFQEAMERGYRYFDQTFFRPGGAIAYASDSLYPIDTHACAQAVLTYCAFRDHPRAMTRAAAVLGWTLAHMRADDGSFFYQRHRCWTNTSPYMRWAQAWMFRALCRSYLVLEQYS